MAFSPRGGTVALANIDTIYLWDLYRNQIVRRIFEKDLLAETACFTADGKHLAGLTKAGTVRFFEAATGRDLGDIGRREADTFCFALSPDGRTLATGHADTTILLWDTADLLGGPRAK